ncbi:MAG: Spy/CpxP family protein refolding chaperone [Planctomycetota bacterium]|jgi:hypothetical protein
MSYASWIARRAVAARWMLAVVLALPLVLMTDRARGQGTSGAVPDPISSRDLSRYSARLGLSDQQRQAIEPFHEEYRAAFRQLREGEIEELLQETGRLRAAGLRGLDRAAIEAGLKNLNRVMSRIRALDDHLFDQIQGVLTDDQSTGLPRVLQARARQRYSSGATRMVGFVNRAARVDLSRMYDDLELTAEERAAGEPFVLRYEVRLTASVKTLYEATTRMFLDMVDALQAQGFGQGEPGQQMGGDQMRQMWMNAWAEALTKPRDAATEISDLNRQTLRQVTELLPENAAATLRDNYLGRAYPEVPRTIQSTAAASYRAALRLEGLPVAMRDDIEASAGHFRLQRDKLIDQMIEYIDAYRGNWSPLAMMGEGREQHQQKLKEHRERLSELDEHTVGALHALLGPPLAGELKAAVARTPSLEDDATAGPGDRMAGGPGMMARRRATDPDADGVGPDPFVPQPISVRDVAVYRGRLNIPEHERFILESLHEDYLSSYDLIKDTDIRALQEARAKRRLDSGEEAAPSPDDIDRVYDLRRRVLEAIRALDGSFFDDLNTLTDSEEQTAVARRLRTAREREVYSRALAAGGLESIFDSGGRGGRSFMGRFGSQSRESGVDLVTLVYRLDLSDQDRAKTDKRLLDYDAKATDSFRQQYETVIRLRAEGEKLSARTRQQAAEEGGENRRRFWRSFRQFTEEYRRQVREAGTPIVELNRATLAAISQDVPAETAAELRQAYNRKAFPGVYQDPQAADRYLAGALKLPGLSDDQRAKISALVDQHRPAYEQMCDQMVEVHAAPDPGPGFDRSAWRRYQERRQRLDVLAFDRNELNAGTKRQLRAVLTEQQRARIGLAEEQEEEERD